MSKNKGVGNPVYEDNATRFKDKMKSTNGSALIRKTGRKINTSKYECYEFGVQIAKSYKHDAFENYKEFLMNDKEFILSIAKITPSPKACKNYFYVYVDENLKSNKAFRAEYLSALLDNNNISRADLVWFVKAYGFQKDFKALLETLPREEKSKLTRCYENQI